MMHVWRLSVAHIGPKSRTERSRKTKIGTEVAHITRGSDTTFKVKGQLAGAGAYYGGLPHSLLLLKLRFYYMSKWRLLVIRLSLATRSVNRSYRSCDACHTTAFYRTYDLPSWIAILVHTFLRRLSLKRNYSRSHSSFVSRVLTVVKLVFRST